MKKLIAALTMFVVALVVFASCDSGPKLLTPEEVKNKIEETVTSEMDALGTQLDAECEQNFTDMVQVATDSIVAARTAEEE